MNPEQSLARLLTRRHFFGRSAFGIGTAALASLLNPGLNAAPRRATPGALTTLHSPARAKNVIFLFQSGGPSQIDLFDYKPQLKEVHGTELPASVRMGQRITGMTAGQKSFPCTSSLFKFQQHGFNVASVVQSGAVRPIAIK